MILLIRSNEGAPFGIGNIVHKREERDVSKFWRENLMEGSHLEDITWILEIGWVGYGPDSSGPAFQEWMCSIE
jgi:hypothetical protein